MFVAEWIVLGIGMSAGLYDAAFATLGGIYGREPDFDAEARRTDIYRNADEFAREQMTERTKLFRRDAVKLALSLPVAAGFILATDQSFAQQVSSNANVLAAYFSRAGKRCTTDRFLGFATAAVPQCRQTALRPSRRLPNPIVTQGI